MGINFCFNWELYLMEFLQNHLGSFGIWFMSIITEFGDATILTVVLGFIYWVYNKDMGKKVGIVLLTSTFLNPMIKDIFNRRRPYFDHPEIRCLKPVSTEGDIYDVAVQGFSFPSGHSMGASSAYGMIMRLIRKKIVWMVCSLLILLVGFSRFALGVHYPTDVLVGWAVGLALVWGLPILQEKIHNDVIFYGILLVCVLPGVFYCRDNDYFTALGLIIGFVLGDFWERKYVHFANTKNVLRGAVRVIGGVAIFLVLNELLKLPFSEEFLKSGELGAFLVRTVRYAIVMFVLIGVYPMAFRKEQSEN